MGSDIVLLIDPTLDRWRYRHQEHAFRRLKVISNTFSFFRVIYEDARLSGAFYVSYN